MLQPGDKKALTILTAVVVAALVIIVGATALVVRGHEESLPTISVQADDTLTQVEPGYWCEVDMTDCEPVDPRSVRQVPENLATSPAPIGSTVLVTVPQDVAAGPWTSVAQYATPQGVVRVFDVHRPDELYTMELRSEPNRVLLGIEFSSLSTVLQDAPQGFDSPDWSVLARGVFAVNTVPDGFEVRNPNLLPDERA
ncbi:DUF2771 family protein [Gordonia zhaorongruii]|uniref:DUF2771 family protein n=1 Tax=Gordonia zhaorongruii TaxID=2597659 RepID=UPI001180267E|nr:DUF2771 family protein [Gordonia zhaorongruii]